MINNKRGIVFIDEWLNDSMCAEYAKRVLQGGLQMLPQKHKEASVCVYKSGFFMTTNKMPYFGEGPDAEAISTCLAVFDTQPLPQVRQSCTRWMRKNCMTVFYYCADKLKNEPLFSDSDDDSDSDGNNSDGFNFSQESFPREIASTTEEVSFSVFLDEMLDTSFLLHDKSNPELWQRDNKHLIYDGDTNSRDYHGAVLLLAAGRYKRADYCENDLHRFQIREKNIWSGVDSLYDAWLILEGKTRKEFKYELFLLRFPGWEDQLYPTILQAPGIPASRKG